MIKYINNLKNKIPEFMIKEKNNKKYILLDFLANEVSRNSMSWLFKIYLEQKYKILKDDNITNYIKNKYKDYNPDIINYNGNLFLNDDLIEIILIELYEDNQLKKENNVYILK